jgi:acyl dehydratase
MAIRVGDQVQVTETIQEETVRQYADLVHDHNPLHLDAAYAARSRFGRPVVHGALLAGYISGVLGQKLPGPGSIYLTQHLEFKAPVFVGDTLTLTVTVEEIRPNGVARLVHEGTVGARLALTGYSLVLLDDRKTASVHEADHP